MNRYQVQDSPPKWVVLDTKTNTALFVVSSKKFAQDECKRLNDAEFLNIMSQML